MHRFLLAIAMLMAVAGCAGLHGGQSVAKFHDGDGPVTAPAPKSGRYVVAYETSGRLRKATDTQRQIETAEPLGFVHDRHGMMIAIAGTEQFAIKGLPQNATFVCWYRQPKNEAGRKFGETLGKGADLLGSGAALVIGGGLDLAALAIDQQINGEDENNDYGYREPPHQRRHHHDDHKASPPPPKPPM